ncbi:MAG: 3'-5' exonuclease [Neisseriaceae bacterium]|nr:3'-5' exonuclease [Neisseriaceae bacterium]
MRSLLSFDIETIPDANGIRSLYSLPENLPDAETVEWMQQKRRAENGTDFMPLHLQKVVAISCCMRKGEEKIKVATLGNITDGEDVMISKFFDIIERETPQLISWNGGGFDLPVLHYRSLVHGITAKRYWDTGDGDAYNSKDFKYSNYINRYHTRHCDLMDLLALFQPKNNIQLDEIAKLCGFPGKLGMDGSKVWSAYNQGRLQEIRDYCETDALNTYLMFLRFELLRGTLDGDEYAHEIELVRQFIRNNQDKEHWQAFNENWK